MESATFRSRLGDGQRLLGTFLKTPTGHATEILGSVGFDFVVIDTEHAPFDRGAVDQMLVAARAAGIAALVRVPDARPAGILSALDCGARGVVIPHVKSAEMASSLVSASRFRGGDRGFSNSTRAGSYGGLGIWDYVDQSDADAAVIGMIEDPEAVECIDEIVAVPGFDAVFIGRGDLTVAYQAPNPGADDVRKATARIAAAAKSAGKAVLAVTPGGDDATWLLGMGVTGLIVASDQAFMRQAATKCLAATEQLEGWE